MKKFLDMKKILPLISGMYFLPMITMAQLFTAETGGPIVSNAGDSRSVNIIDVNNDGWEDVFISNGPNGGDVNFLYLNNGDGSFTKLNNDDIANTPGSYDGATFGDYDNDGDPDAFVVTWYGEKNHFFRNNGNGTFTEEPTITPAIPGTYSETASWGDYDLDGWLDLYVSNSDGDFKNLLYHNNGDGTFTKMFSGQQSTDAKATRGVTWIDFDLDGDNDLYAANESGQANDMYVNEGNGIFSKMTSDPIVSDTRSTMSASWGDIDNDGDPDLFTANSSYFSGQKNQLFRNNGNGTFAEVTTGDAANDFGCSFSSAFADVDNDGDLDLAVSNGFCNGSITNFLYRNDGSGNFTRDYESITDLSTPCSYGVAFGDLNNDGFPELIFATCNNNDQAINAPDIMYTNNGNSNHWLKVKAEGSASNRSAIGAKVRVKATINGVPVWQYREITAQSGYCSQNSLIAHFGLGDAINADSLWIQFPGGADTVLTNVSSDQQLLITEASLTAAPAVHMNSVLECFPAPADHTLIISLTLGSASDIQMQLFDVTGKSIGETTVSGTTGKNRIQWRPAGADSLSGTYLLNVTANGGSTTMKVSFF